MNGHGSLYNLLSFLSRSRSVWPALEPKESLASRIVGVRPSSLPQVDAALLSSLRLSTWISQSSHSPHLPRNEYVYSHPFSLDICRPEKIPAPACLHAGATEGRGAGAKGEKADVATKAMLKYIV